MVANEPRTDCDKLLNPTTRRILKHRRRREVLIHSVAGGLLPERRASNGFLEIDDCNINLSDSIAIRISSDTRPHNLMLAGLQKGLRIVYKGREIVGEGIGFGVPILLYSDDTYFSGTSKLYLDDRKDVHVIRKEFLFDRVQRKVMHGIKMQNAKLRQLWRYLDRLYQNHRSLQPVSSADVLGKLGVHLQFSETDAAGKVIAAYSVSHDRIRAKMDFFPTRESNLKGVFVLNEQGSEFFRRYSDSNGTELVDKEIGAWGIVEAESARVTDLRGRVGFQLARSRGSVLHRGREYTSGLADWVGLDYEIDPAKRTFEYEIQVLGA
ncbi:MAG: hypothetical protein WED04_08230 [Promethearchaeati archaeon SRVP18_Atabeyarchaeia-1]